MNEIPTRRAWAPFVGAALAMLTTGSLVVFALVAQRTSLDGFSNDRVAAVRPADAPPAAITIPGGSAPSRSASDGGSPTGDDSGAISIDSPDVPGAAPSFFEIVTTSPAPQGRDTIALASPSEGAGDDAGALEAPNQRLAEERALFARSGGGEPSDGEVAGSGPSHDGKHSRKSHDAKDKIKKSKKSKKSKEQRSKAESAGRRHASSGSTPRSGSAGASRPARPASQPSPKAKRSSGRPPHSNAGGNGKARGRGHGKR